MNKHKMPTREKAIIFGCGEAGVAANINLKDSYDVIGFCDNSPSKIGTSIAGKTVYAAADLANFPQAIILIASEFSEQIFAQLTNHESINPIRIRILSAQVIKHFSIGNNEVSRTGADQVLLKVSEFLQQQQCKHYVDAGTLLGIYRDGELIPWDDDLDFAVDALELDKMQDLLSSLCDQLLALSHQPWSVDILYSEEGFFNVPANAIRGFKLRTETPSNIWPMVDFFVKYSEGDWMDYTLSSRGFRMPSAHMLVTESFFYQSHRIMIPSQVEAYLERHYGDWRTPNPQWNLSQLKNATVFTGSPQ